MLFRSLTGKTVTLPAGVGGHASGTEANRPAAPAIGTIYFNTDEDTLQQYTSAGWESIGLAQPAISSVSGTIYNTIASNLTISGAAFGVAATVRFAYGGSTSDVVVTPTSDTEITVAVPSAVYNQAVGTSVTIAVIVGGQISNGSSKTVQEVPTGGTITTFGVYRIHAFTSSGTFTVPSGITLNSVYVAIVAGGGSGAHGGGGAGGVLTQTLSPISSNSYPINVGSGGPGGSSPANGTNSTAFGYTAIGGGVGGNGRFGSGSGGGSGGGASFDLESTSSGGGPGTQGQGNRGGHGSGGGANAAASGGGGAGGIGGAGSPTGIGLISGTEPRYGGKGGDGGPGIDLSGFIGTTLGEFGWFSGGGGGGSNINQDMVAELPPGGQGGGGDGSTTSSGTNQAGTAGTQNTGGGGGGGDPEVDTSSFRGGGSGIVIVRYQLT